MLNCRNLGSHAKRKAQAEKPARLRVSKGYLGADKFVVVLK
jgi:hypothetical protein